MNSITITPKELNGSVVIPPSKSISHRAIVCASLARGISELKNVGDSEDINATIECMSALGAKITRYDDKLLIDGTNTLNVSAPVKLNCRESGSTLRFLIPLALLATKKVTFDGQGRLPKRPLDIYLNLFDKFDIEYNKCSLDYLPLTVKSGDIQGKIRVEGNVSSQFISGLLFTLPLYPQDSEIIVTTPLESKAYVDLTIDVMQQYGITITNYRYKKFKIKGGQQYKPCNYTIEADYSQAAFFLAAGAIGNFVVCKGLNTNTKQGDKKIIEIIKKMGGKVIIDNEKGISALPSNLHGCTIDVSQIPDLVPAIAVLAINATGETVIKGASRLRLKESDRLSTIAQQLNSLGGTIIEKGDSLIIEGTEKLSGGATNSCNDHRIAMAVAIASSVCEELVTVDDYKCTDKSYPQFWNDYISLGGKIDFWDN
ncbi:MAG: 3-phosphoshikimate 1-carboxyvinyltransferase [Clostridia bacterium]|nr:3-phosphoshikimate 1-carboxyvinyltransferase [Clostridia bacterium]